MIKFDIKNRFTGAVQFTAEIDCADDAPLSLKVGLAVRWAVKTRADLAGANLAGAYLARANLAGADLARADLARANLAGAYLARAYLAGADLARADLADADLADADLAGADLASADLAGAYLARAYLAGAYLAGAKIVKLVARATRSDGYEFFGWSLDDGRALIRAGCRTMTLAEYRQHVDSYGNNAAKARETTDILDFIERRASA